VPGRIEVASRGTQPNQALEVPQELVELGAERGVRGLQAHAPHRLATGAVTGADLILTATTAHSAWVLSDAAAAHRRTFTMLEFGALVRLLDERTDGTWLEPGTGVRAMAESAGRHRVLARAELGSLELADPFGRGEQDYARMVQALGPALEATASALERAVSGSASGRPADRP
jgi:protein-tyrosine phosphatase